MTNIYKQLPRPFLVLAPMENVTDVVFREVMATLLPRPDLFFTEFTNVHGLNSGGKKHTLQKLEFTENQRPIIAQIWGTKPEYFEKAARLVQDLGFDGVDINMGCPDRKVLKGGAGAALADNPDLAVEIIQATKRGAPNIPVSVKTRLGVKERKTEEWTTTLLKQEIAVLTMHTRTAKEMSNVPADWSELDKVVKLRDELAPQTLIVGNGDVTSHVQAMNLAKKHRADGIMIARGVFSDPWVFSADHPNEEEMIRLRFKVMKQHVQMYHQRFGDKKFDVLKKFFKMYLNSFRDAATVRAKFMECKTAEEFLKCYDSLNVES